MVALCNISIPIRLLSGTYSVPVCTKRVWGMLKQCRTDADHEKVCKMLLEGVPLPLHDQKLLVSAYESGMERLREEAELTLPYYKTKKSADDVKYTVYTELDKLAADYANMTIYEIDSILITEYWLILRDAFIHALSRTEKGRKYLKNAYRLTQTEADENINIGRK